MGDLLTEDFLQERLWGAVWERQIRTRKNRKDRVFEERKE